MLALCRFDLTASLQGLVVILVPTGLLMDPPVYLICLYLLPSQRAQSNTCVCSVFKLNLPSLCPPLQREQQRQR